jgi:hypothetical protein
MLDFLRGMVAWLGGRQSEVLYDRDSRFAGNTGYTLMKMVKLAMADLTSFSTVPLRLAAILTMFGMFIGCAVALYAVAGRLLGNVVPVGPVSRSSWCSSRLRNSPVSR